MLVFWDFFKSKPYPDISLLGEDIKFSHWNTFHSINPAYLEFLDKILRWRFQQNTEGSFIPRCHISVTLSTTWVSLYSLNWVIYMRTSRTQNRHQPLRITKLKMLAMQHYILCNLTLKLPSAVDNVVLTSSPMSANRWRGRCRHFQYVFLEYP